mmetsp:Transcript_27397/g.85537  ORF Transcript_27397/g.85537 Transcript_27397/m.85537 type:complete len:534 (-) Transcript_27397:179-1780(-)
MARQQALPPLRRPRTRPARACAALLCAVFAARLSAVSLSFVSGLAGRTAPPTARGAAAVTRGSRLTRASRGGEAAEGLQTGDKVQAVSPDDEQRYPGVIEAANADGTYVVRWDDPDGGPETNDIEAGKIRKIVIFKDYVAGDDVKAISPDDGNWYPGSVSAANADGTFQVKWDDPDGGPETNDVKPEEMKKVTVFKDYKVDDDVEAVFPEDGQMYPGKVIKVNGDGTFQVKWEDPDGGPEDSPIGPKQMRYPPIPVESLEVGAKYTGTVRSVRDFGGFVDIGATGDGLVHISRVADERVDNIHDYLEEGQEVEVWVSEVRDDGKFGLTMVEGKLGGGGGKRREDVDLAPFADIPDEEWLDGTVANIAPFGAFVEVSLPDGPTAQGLVHISRIRDGFVDSVEDEVSVGQAVRVRIDSVDLERGKLGLSMRESGMGGTGGGGGGRAPADLSAFAGLHPDEWLKGTVARTAPFGAFVTVALKDGAQADGLVHITQIKDGFVESVDDEVSVGQEVQVRVVNVDVEAGKIGLSMKPPE